MVDFVFLFSGKLRKLWLVGSWLFDVWCIYNMLLVKYILYKFYNICCKYIDKILIFGIECGLGDGVIVVDIWLIDYVFYWVVVYVFGFSDVF